MNNNSKMLFERELEKFIITRLRPFPTFPDFDNFMTFENACINAKDRLEVLDERRNWLCYKYKKRLGELVHFPQLTNHEICHEMFWNAFRGRSKMYIQIQDLRFDDGAFSNKTYDTIDTKSINEEKEVLTFQCSLLTLQMLDYDLMMFSAMADRGDEEYQNAAQQYYRPYLFSYVAEINQEKYKELQMLQKKLLGSEKHFSDNEVSSSPYLWLACTFAPDVDIPCVDLKGYVVQSASSINKIPADLKIIENEKTPIEIVNSILDGYELINAPLSDNIFTNKINKELGGVPLAFIDIFKIGNGNCVFAQSEDPDKSFFYDIGFNYRHRPQRLVPGVSYNYSSTMKEIVKKAPSFLILSHWDMDHIAGSAAARKKIFEKKWFAPDCFDACADAKRLAKYLDLKGNLSLVNRRPRKSTYPGRLIGQIDISTSASPSQTRAVYKLYMGKKAKCDSSYPNCEGIVIEYTDILKEKTVLMMGDVNYSSFNKARRTNNELSFADTQIDYLIAPHHGSEHTDYTLITDPRKILKTGSLAVICCTNEINDNRPNNAHLTKLTDRFDNVLATEEIKAPDVSKTISF